MELEDKLDVLVIEDDPITRELICWELSNNPILNIHSFENGEECYKNYKGEPHILVSDYNLQGNNERAMNGIKFSNLFPRINKILLTGSRSEQIAEKTVKYSFLALIHKNNAWLKDLRQVIGNIVDDIQNPQKVINKNKRRLMLSRGIFVALILALSALFVKVLYDELL